MYICESIEMIARDFNACPLCKGDAVIHNKQFFDDMKRRRNASCISDRCVSCGLELNGYAQKNDAYETIVTQMREKWNRLQAS